MPNRLLDQNSPYLRQHAHNPVDWEPWGPEALSRARRENKLILISIGYAACHWCHVMERECFEDNGIAELMDTNFVCIKVDREERPDIDQVYMEAVQAMTGRGGWPLNCFALPDERPVFGGTYFPRETWIDVLQKLAALWKSDPSRLESYAAALTEGLRTAQPILTDLGETPGLAELTESVARWSATFDFVEGGTIGSPKFPLPDNYRFLLRHVQMTQDKDIENFAFLTLERMAAGGIYDQLGGGFCRYSTDRYWKVPHFEKMLYDNAQLVCLYAEAFLYSGRPRYREIVEESLTFVNRELRVADGQWASSLDADSGGEEGLFYVWTLAELKEVVGSDWANFQQEYDLGPRGQWEDGKIILLQRTPGETPYWEGREATSARLVARRETRVRPALDSKVLTSWNGLMVTAWVKAWEALGNPWYKAQATAGARSLRTVHRNANGLWHSAAGGVSGFLEDYCFTIEAFLAAYRLDFDESYLIEAARLMELALELFFDPDSPLLFFTSHQEPALLLRKHEVSDNVIPSSNAVMAEQLYYLGHFFGQTDWIERAKRMLTTRRDSILEYGSGSSRWMQLQQLVAFPFLEIVVVGPDWRSVVDQMKKTIVSKVLWAAGPGDSQLPLLRGRPVFGKTVIYVCKDNVCDLPTENIAEALRMVAVEHGSSGC